jgi:hypothetical protein
LAILNGAGQNCAALDTPSALSGTFTPGCYSAADAIDTVADAIVTLNGGGDPNAVFIFKSGAALTTGARTKIVLTNGASAANVFWVPVGATSLGANTAFVGNILDAAGITMGDSATLLGRALAFGGVVTTAGNIITVPSTLRVEKVVVGSVADPSIFTINVKKNDVLVGTAVGAATPGTYYSLVAGTYVVSEDVASYSYYTKASVGIVIPVAV